MRVNESESITPPGRFLSGYRRVILGILISVIAIAWIWATGVFSELSIEAPSGGWSYRYLLIFALGATVVPVVNAWRWSLLVDRRLGARSSLVCALLCIGGNMVLPARGGELLRILHTHRSARISAAEIVSRVILEKALDLFFVVLVGLCGALVLGNLQRTEAQMTLMGLALPLAGVIAGFAILKTRPKPLLRALRWCFALVRREALFDRHVAHLIGDLARSLTTSVLAGPVALTLLLWFVLYAGTYWVVAKFVGIDLAYAEVLIVICAGALGLMLPAAPSGLGTFHASVVSAFILIGRSASEGLLLGTAVHLLFFLAIGLPTVPLFLYSHHKAATPRSTQ